MSLQRCVLGIVIVALLVLQAFCADIETNEVNDGADSYMLQGVRVYPNDRQCALVGGLCVRSGDCLEPTTNKGLCPSSSHLGVECCYELPVRPAPCVEHLGECMDRCHRGLQRPGIDCENGQVCCVVI